MEAEPRQEDELLDGRRLAVGAPSNAGNASAADASAAGSVRVFDYNATREAWERIGCDIDGNFEGSLFGWSVSLSADGSKLAVGAPGNASQMGEARVYEFASSGASCCGGACWSQVANTMSAAVVGGGFASSVSLSPDGGSIVAGAPGEGDADGAAGVAIVYALHFGRHGRPDRWLQIGDDIDGSAAGDQFGASVSLALYGDVVAVGAPFYSSKAKKTNQGQVCAFMREDGSSCNDVHTF